MDNAELVGQTIADGRYRIVRLLGEGGMGAVYEARQVAMDRRVALKLIHPTIVHSQEAVGRFHHEMRATSKVEHENTVRVYDFGESDGRLFLAMEFLEGRTLKQLVAEVGRLPVARVLHIGAQVLRGIGAAHQEGLVHRDLKPENIMLLDRYGEADVVKVLDFGIAHSLDEAATKLTAAGSVIGTPKYMSPEQAMGRPIDARSDLYSFGVLLYELLAGVAPFDRPTLSSLIVAHATEPPPALAGVVAGLPPALTALVMQLLAKEPAARPQSAPEVLQRLSAIPLDAAAPAPSRRWLPLAGGALMALAAALLVVRAGARHDGGGMTRAQFAAAQALPAAPVGCASPAALPSDWSTRAHATLAADATLPLELRVWAADRLARDDQAPAPARAALAAVVAQCAGYAYAHKLLGDLDYQADRLDDARDDYRAALTADATLDAARFNLALTLLRAHATADALAALDALVARAPAYPHALATRAQARALDHQLAPALADAEAATAQAPGDDKAWLLVGQLRAQLGTGDAHAAYCRAAQLGNPAAAAHCQ